MSGAATILEEACNVTFLFSANDDDPLLLTLSVARPPATRWQPVAGFDFAISGLVARLTPRPVVEAVNLEFDGTLYAGTAEFAAALTLPAIASGDWTLELVETSHPFSSGLLKTMTGSDTSASVLPSAFALDQFKLTHFEITFSLSEGACRALKLGLEYDPSPPWQPFGNRFAFTAFAFDFVGFFGKQTTFQAVATAKTIIGPAHVDVTVQFPDQAITIYLDRGTTLSVPQVFEAFGIELPTDFPDIQISTLTLGLYVEAQHVDFALAIDTPFVIANGVQLERFHFNLGISYAGSVSGFGALYAAFAIPVGSSGDVTLELSGAYDTSGALSITGQAGNVPAGDLLAALLGKFGISTGVIPAPIRDLTIVLLSATFVRTGGAASTDTFHFRCDATTTIAGADAELIPELTITYDEAARTWQVDFKGQLILTEADGTKLEFDIEFGRAPTDTFFLASFTSSRPIGFADLAGIFGFALPTIPAALDLDLLQLTMRYDTGGTQGASSLVLEAESSNANYGKAVYATLAADGGLRLFDGTRLEGAIREHAFLLAANRTLSLSQLPLVGPALASIGEVALTGIEAAIAYEAPIDTVAAAAMNAAITQSDPGNHYPRLPTTGLPQRILLAADLAIGGDAARHIAIPLGGSGQVSRAVASSVGDASSATKWFDIQKSFGPVSIQKVGLRYADGTLWGVMNASLEAGPVQLGLIGLGVGSPLESFSPKFTVEGITLSVAAGPVGFSGALVGTIDPVDLYGELGLSLPSFSIGALGAYANYEHHPSAFLYAVLAAELGGPPFFFVTGLAAGFALNRTLVIPPVGSLGTFPLIAWATGGGPSSQSGGDTGDKVLAAMTQLAESGVVAPSIGEYWLAAGIKFSSFQLINSFALLTIKFGNDFEIDLLGLSSISLPPDDADNAIAMAELALEVSFVPAHGLIAVSGQLTSRSFLLSRACHLTGGFAFYFWFAGDHAGEFVLSLGGYSPRFGKPSFYPDVPRLGLNWQVDENLSVAGDEYFALTPSAVMAGGGLRAVWSSGAISAWFVVQADFLLLFRPLHYYLSASIDLGASVDIDLWFTSYTLSVHLSVGGELWGPPFGGHIHVDLDIVSFTIGFGDDEKIPDPISWSSFVDQVLPSRGAQMRNEAVPAMRPRHHAVADPTPTPAVQINGTRGVLKTLPPVPDAVFPLDWLVDGDAIAIAVASTIPVTEPALASSGDASLIADPEDHSTWSRDIAVGPSAIAAGDFVSTLTVMAWSNEDTTFYATRTIGGVPKAVWQVRALDRHGIPSGVDPMAETLIEDGLVGLVIMPQVPAGQKTLPIAIRNLQYTDAGPRVPLPWSDPTVFSVDPFTDQSVHATIAAPVPSGNRAAMIAAVNRGGFAVTTAIDVATLADADSGALLAPPILRYLVEAR